MTAPIWDPAEYHRFEGERLRPALDLLARVDLEHPAVVHDVGCGRGDLARIAAERWPEAIVIGSDSSSEMLEAAAATPSRVRWVRLDVRNWDPDPPPDLILANSVLHWLADHEDLFPRLYHTLAPGGILAVQMPLTSTEPTFAAIRLALATGGPGGGPLGPESLRARFERPWVRAPEWYHDLLSAEDAAVEVWTTRYYQVLDGPNPVFEWIKGAALRPVIAALDPTQFDAFSSRCRDALAAAYPPRPDGTTVLAYPRLFIVARRP